MTLDDAWCLIRHFVSRANGGNVRPVASLGGACPLLTLDLAPGPPCFSSPRPSPAGTGPGRRVGQVPVSRCPRLAGLFRTALSGLGTRQRPHYSGGNPERPVPVAGGQGEWPGSAAVCGSPGLPAVVPPAGGARAGAGGGAGDGALEADRRCPGSRCPAGPRSAAALQARRCPRSGRGVLAGTTTGRAADPAHGREPPPLTPGQPPAATRPSGFPPQQWARYGSGARSGRSWTSRPAGGSE
jgi:hypothetical protein